MANRKQTAKDKPVPGKSDPAESPARSKAAKPGPAKAAASRTAASVAEAAATAKPEKSATKGAVKKPAVKKPAPKPSAAPIEQGSHSSAASAASAAADGADTGADQPSARDFDIVIFGATGFTGGLTAEYLARHAPAKLRWALAGRTTTKLEAVRARLAVINPACATLPLLLADSTDAESLEQIAVATRVVITTVGPYILHGEPLVAACAAHGTDYVDLTGEPEFVDLMWLRYHDLAVHTGARLVHCCGFDSIPHDLGAFFTMLQLPEDVPLKIEGFVSARGQFSAGTYHSAINAFARLREYQQTRTERRQRELRPLDRRIGSAGAGLRRLDDLGTWAVPFPTIDGQVVKRSAALIERYGSNFRYSHYLQLKTLSQVALLLGGVGALVALAQWRPTRDWLLAKRTSGQGPSEDERARARFSVRFIGTGGGRRVVTQVSGGDPGYGETSKMLAESALCLALDHLPKRSGQLTPAAAMGEALLDRLQAAGIRFEVLEEGLEPQRG